MTGQQWQGLELKDAGRGLKDTRLREATCKLWKNFLLQGFGRISNGFPKKTERITVSHITIEQGQALHKHNQKQQI